MTIIQRNEKGVIVLNLSDNIASDGVAILKNFIKPYLEDQTVQTIIINLEKINFIDSSGIGLIISVFKKLLERKAKLILTNMNEKNIELFEMMHLNKILTLYETESEALKNV